MNVFLILDVISIAIIGVSLVYLVRSWGRNITAMKVVADINGRNAAALREMLTEATGLLTELNRLAETVLDINREQGAAAPPASFTDRASNLPLLGRHAAEPEPSAAAADIVEAVVVDESELCGPCQCSGPLGLAWQLHCHYHRCPYSVMWGCESTRAVHLS